MKLTLLKAKLHLARVTHTQPEYEGSCAIDAVLLEHAGILEYEQIAVYNMENGERFTTYAIAAAENSGTVSMLGAAAHKAGVDDRVIICAYAAFDERAARLHKPAVVYLDDNNRIVRTVGNLQPVKQAIPHRGA